MKSKNRCRRKTLTLLHSCILTSVSIVKLSWLVSMPHRKMAPRLYDSGGHKPLNPAAVKYRTCPAIPSARDQKQWGLPVAELTLRCQSKESISDSQIGWIRTSVLSIRRVDRCCGPKANNLLCQMTRPFVRTQKRPGPLHEQIQASLTFGFFDRL